MTKPPINKGRDVFGRLVGLEKELKLEHPEIFIEQKHLDAGIEKAYWHYGYLSALKDILRSFCLIERKKQLEL